MGALAIVRAPTTTSYTHPRHRDPYQAMQGHHEGPALRKIANAADSLRNLVGIPQTSSRTNLQDNHIPPLDLPFPNDILKPLSSIGLPDHMLQRISNSIFACIDKSTRMHLSNYEESCKTLLALPPVPGSLPLDVLANLRTVYQTSYTKRYLSWIKSQVNNIAVAWHRGPSNKKRKPFNYEYIPLLEEYFKYKAYPSGPDRQMLARKCAMTPRQIEVWFQNHRNRSRKEGANKPLRRVQTDIDLENLEVPLRSLEEKMPLFTNPVCERKGQDISESLSDNGNIIATTVLTETNVVDVLDIPAASHAYPVVYKPAASNDPPHTIKFPPPAWIRRPATATAPLNAVVDVDHIIEQFSRLHLRDPSRKHLRRNNVTDIQLLRSGKCCWFASRFVIPPTARHPAFIPTRLPAMSSSVPLVGSTMSPLAETVDRGRKIAGFPKRTPTDMRCSKHIGPILSCPSPSRHCTSHSRSSSLNSISSFDTRSVSSSSSISTAPSTPSSSPHTPSHTSLPSMSPTCSIETADNFHTLHSIIQQSDFQRVHFSEYSTETQGLTLPMLSLSFKPSTEYTSVHT